MRTLTMQAVVLGLVALVIAPAVMRRGPRLEPRSAPALAVVAPVDETPCLAVPAVAPDVPPEAPPAVVPLCEPVSEVFYGEVAPVDPGSGPVIDPSAELGIPY